MMGMYATAAIAEDIEALDWNEPETTVNMDEAVDVGDEGDATGGAEITDQEERRGGFRVYFKRIHPYRGHKVRVRCTAHICKPLCYLIVPQNWIHWHISSYGNPITRVPIYVTGTGRGVLAIRGAYHLRRYQGNGPMWLPVKWCIPGVTSCWKWAPAFNGNYRIICGRKYWLYNGICVFSKYRYLNYRSTKYYDDFWMTLFCRVGADVDVGDVDTSDAATGTPLSDAEIEKMSDMIYGMESVEEGTEVTDVRPENASQMPQSFLKLMKK
jgi:hypothetical protein